MEIERKFKIISVPEHLESYPCAVIEQAYLCTDPVVRVRRKDDRYILTVKGGGMMAREEYELPLTAESYAHLLAKADGRIITKHRYLIPYGDRTIELDIFDGELNGLIIAEVEFDTVEAANAFVPPDWFGEDVTMDGRYHNSSLSRL